MTLRKNFTMTDSVVFDLEFLAKKMHKKQSQVIQELIKQKMKEFEKDRKIEILEKMSGMFTGKIPQDLSIQSIKADSEN